MVRALSKKYSNWGKWGKDDEIGALNYNTPQKIVQAAKLVNKGKVFSLSIPFGPDGPQIPRPGSGRFNPIHFMLRTGTDVVSAKEPIRIPRAADDAIIMPLQGATHWDGLSHSFDLDNRMYNGWEASLVTSRGTTKNGIERLKDKIVGRGVLLDMARYKGRDWLEPSFAITTQDLKGCVSHDRISVETGDFVLVRTGHLEKCRSEGSWEDYLGGRVPGLSLETLSWLYESRVAGIASDTGGVEVRPNQTEDVREPWHRVATPSMGLLVGEIFDLEELAKDCASDNVYEFLFVAQVLPITGAVGSPTNPLAIK
jgi:kynurenine formamidase